jgi:hypothetical protein
VFGKPKARVGVTVPSLREIAPLLVDSTGFESNVDRITSEWHDFGGQIQARLFPEKGRIRVELYYGRYRANAGWLERAPLGTVYSDIVHVYRRGSVATTAIEIVSRPGGRHSGGYLEVWVNPRDEAMDPDFAPEFRLV